MIFAVDLISVELASLNTIGPIWLAQLVLDKSIGLVIQQPMEPAKFLRDSFFILDIVSDGHLPLTADPSEKAVVACK